MAGPLPVQRRRADHHDRRHPGHRHGLRGGPGGRGRRVQRVPPAGPADAGHHRVGSVHRATWRPGVQRVDPQHRQPRVLGRRPGGVAHRGGDVVPVSQGVAHEVAADATGGAEDGDPHVRSEYSALRDRPTPCPGYRTGRAPAARPDTSPRLGACFHRAFLELFFADDPPSGALHPGGHRGVRRRDRPSTAGRPRPARLKRPHRVRGRGPRGTSAASRPGPASPSPTAPVRVRDAGRAPARGPAPVPAPRPG